MQSFDEALVQLVREGKIDPGEAFKAAREPQEVHRQVGAFLRLAS